MAQLRASGTKVEVDGITVSVSRDDVDDIDVIEAIADVNSDLTSDTDKMAAAIKVFRLVFGSDYERVKSELRDQHDGRCSVETFMQFFSDVLEAVGAKNS